MRLQLAPAWRPAANVAHKLVWVDDGPVTCATCAATLEELTCPATRAVKAFAMLHDVEWRDAVTRSREENGMALLDLEVQDSSHLVRVIFL
jgi:hypothetical protein